MQNLSFDDGYKEFTINNDKNRVIRFNPSDMGIVGRIQEAYNKIEDAGKEVEEVKLKNDGSPFDGLEETAEKIKKYDTAIKEAIDCIFNSEICDIAFGKQSPISLVGNGKFLWEAFLECIIAMVEKETKKKVELSKAKIGKYKAQVYRK